MVKNLLLIISLNLNIASTDNLIDKHLKYAKSPGKTYIMYPSLFSS